MMFLPLGKCCWKDGKTTIVTIFCGIGTGFQPNFQATAPNLVTGQRDKGLFKKENV
jgi:hypothetical protein